MITHPGITGAGRLESILNILMRGGMILILILVPLPFGSVEPWAYSAMEIAVALVGLVFVYRQFMFPSAKVVFPIVLLPPIGFLCLMGLQLVPLPKMILERITPSTAALYSQTVPGYSDETRDIVAADRSALGNAAGPESQWRPISQTPAATWAYLLKGVAYTGFLFLFLNVFRNKRHLRLSLYALVAIGTGEAFYGLLEYLTGHQHIFTYQKKYYLEAATGTFINRNHFAAFLEMALLVGIGLLFSRMRTSLKGANWRERLLGLTDRRAGLNLSLILCLCILSIALVLSFSRAGMILGFASAGAFSLLQLRKEWSLKKTILIGCLAIAILLPAYGIGYWTLTGRYAVLAEEFSAPGGRLDVWENSLRIVRDFPLLGSGVGTFQYVFPRYREASITAIYDYTHNDYLQVVSEAGIAGAILLLIGIVVVGRIWSGNRKCSPPEQVLSAACGFGILSVGLHEFVDFGLQIPANLVALSIIAGALTLLQEPQQMDAGSGGRK